MTHSRLHADAGELLRVAGWSSVLEFLDPIEGGANNQVFRVGAGGRSALLKRYYHDPNDPRDRLDSEFVFCRFAWEHGIRTSPQPLARCDRRHMALYEFVHGSRLKPGDVGNREIDQALAFCLELERHRRTPEAAGLPAASEACFSLTEHVDCVERRVSALLGLPTGSDLDHRASEFVKAQLVPKWQEIRSGLHDEWKAAGLRPDRAMRGDDRCISPSDFGFHNAIAEPEGRLRFIDFEYAGWDDPAKLICDFFCQPAVPVPRQYLGMFSTRLLANRSDAEGIIRRVVWLLPVYRVKWCCIILNEFMAAGGRRRSFAGHRDSTEDRKAEQLAKAIRCLEESREIPGVRKTGGRTSISAKRMKT